MIVLKFAVGALIWTFFVILNDEVILIYQRKIKPIINKIPLFKFFRRCNISYKGIYDDMDKIFFEFRGKNFITMKKSNIIAKNDLEAVIKLDEEAFGKIPKKYKITNAEMYYNLYAISPHSIRLIKLNQKPVGLTVVLLLNQKAFELYLNGDLSLYEFSKENIIPLNKANEKRIVYVHSIYNQLENSYLAKKKLMLCLNDHIGTFLNSTNSKNNILVTEGVSSDGIRIIKKFGLANNGQKSKDGEQIFYLNLSNISKLSPIKLDRINDLLFAGSSI